MFLNYIKLTVNLNIDYLYLGEFNEEEKYYNTSEFVLQLLFRYTYYFS